MTDQPTMKQLRQRRRVAAARMMTHFLEAGPVSTDDLNLYAISLGRDLTEEDRLHLLRLLVMTFPADLAEQAVNAVFEDAGWPVTGLGEDPREDALLWVKDASGRELRAYAAACLKEMSRKSRDVVLKWANKLDGAP